jgi:ABC-2 type transport system permease protein
MTIRAEYESGTWQPSPGAAPRLHRIRTQALADLRSTLGNPEQLLLTLIIPLGLLVALSVFEFGDSPTSGVTEAVPSVIALAVLSTAFTSLAIGTGFDRRSGALKFLGTTPLTRGDLLVGRALSIMAIEVIQVALIVAVGYALGWRPEGSWWAAFLLVLVGTAAFAALGFALAGVLRAEATLAVANAVFLLLMLGGGIIIPADRLPGVWGSIVSWLPSGALADGLREVLINGGGLPLTAIVVLLVWGAIGAVVAARTFRWE